VCYHFRALEATQVALGEVESASAGLLQRSGACVGLTGAREFAVELANQRPLWRETQLGANCRERGVIQGDALRHECANRTDARSKHKQREMIQRQEDRISRVIEMRNGWVETGCADSSPGLQ
jgi:hypothetical protein